MVDIPLIKLAHFYQFGHAAFDFLGERLVLIVHVCFGHSCHLEGLVGPLKLRW